MRRFKLFFGAAVAVAGLVSLPGCVGEQEALIITRAIPFPDTGECFADPMSNNVQLVSDVVDVSFETGYTVAFAVQNNLNQTGTDGTNTGIEASELKLTEAIVEFQANGNSDVVDAVRATDGSLVRFSQPVASVSFTGGDTVAPFVFVPTTTIDEFRTQMGAAGIERLRLNMSVKFRALRSSNSTKAGTIESRSFEFPLELCTNCLRACAPTLTTGDEPTDLCDASRCATETAIGGGGICGNAQTVATNPLCCTGADADSQQLFCQ